MMKASLCYILKIGISTRYLRSSLYSIYDNVSEKKFPGFRKTIWLECIQEQNEIVFVPSGWYHQVHNLEDTISINHNWFNAYNLSWVCTLLLRDYNIAKEYIEDICDNFEGLCQQNLAANTGCNSNVHDESHGHHDDGVPPPPEEIKEHDGGSTASSSSASSSPREHHCSRSAEELPGSEPVDLNGSTPGVVLVEDVLEEEESSIVVEETTFSSTTEFFAKSEGFLVETTKYDEEDEGSAVPVEKIVALAEEERQGDEIALAEVQVKVVLLTDALETVEAQLDESHGDHCFGGKAEALHTTELTPSPPVLVRPTTW